MNIVRDNSQVGLNFVITIIFLYSMKIKKLPV